MELDKTKIQSKVDKTNVEYVKDIIEQASDLIAPAWSLKNFVAANPLQCLESLKFERAASKAKEYFQADILPNELITFNAYKKGDLDLKTFEDIYARKVVNQTKTFIFKNQQIDREKFLLNTMIQSAKPYQASLESKKVQKFIDDVTASNKDFFQSDKSLELLSRSKSKKFFKLVNSSLIRWLERFYDEGQASIEMPNRDKGIYLAWKELAVMKDLSSEQKDFIRDLPEDSSEALVYLLESLNLEKEDWEEYLRLSFMAMPGWSSFIKWRIEYQSESAFNKIAPPSLIDYLALRLALEKVHSYSCDVTRVDFKSQAQYKEFLEWVFIGLLKKGFSTEDLLAITQSELNDISNDLLELYLQKGIIYLESIEETVNNKIQADIKKQLDNKEEETRAKAQIVFCIDVRSEPFRKSIEAQGQYQTFGYAGFFGVPVKYKSTENEECLDLCPVLLKPNHEVHEESFEDKIFDKFKRSKYDSFIKSLNKSMKDLKVNFASIFVFSEASGLFYMFRILFKTLLPKAYFKVQKFFSKIFLPKIHYQPVLDYKKTEELTLGIATEDQLIYARNALRMIGLTKNFAPYVIFCGHGSKTTNNPYASALDCGACGGAHGGPNAKVIAKILNTPIIRENLAKEGIDIPKDTVFLAAQHNTTDDSVEIFSDGKREYDLKEIQADLEKAKQMNNLYRLQTFSNSNSPDYRVDDWSEVRPEWGLAGNSSFIIAPRAFTKNLDLGSRSFLHSYNYWEDESSSSLETIMTAPMIVTQWINSQYYFSTVNNVNFGSGSKITHNVMGTCGVVQGNSSDLMTGLALQSVNSTDDENYHTPVRITNYIYAPMDKVKAIVDKHEMLQTLIGNEWIKLVVIDPETKSFNRVF
jgi:uncharacterized protein YbcC (UPF0753/DUF2309 family)